MNMNESRAMIIKNIDLPENLVYKAVRHAQLIAKRNRCKSWDKKISVISGDMYDIEQYGYILARMPSEETLGVCWKINEWTRCIYIRPGGTEHEMITTLCHELAHAFTNPNASHSYSWRSLNLLYFATLPRIFGLKLGEYEFTDEITYVRNRYEPRGYTPIHRHLNAMNRMLTWYVKTVEKDSAL